LVVVARFRIASWNVQLGLQLDEVVAGLDHLGRPHLLALQEASEREGRSDSEVITHALGRDYRSCQVVAQHLRGVPQANAVVWDASKLTATRTSVLELPVPTGRLLKRLPESRRNAVVVDAKIERTTLRLYAVHLDVFGLAHKEAQLAAVLDDADRRRKVDLTVIAGDLNTYGLRGRPSWAGLRGLVAEHGFEDLTAGVAWTHRARPLIRQKLDAVLARPAGLRHRAKALLLPGSDHIPVVVDVELP
jgi:endonuclease/exonuclease/phosphatase family metal-dependent hydrolase